MCFLDSMSISLECGIWFQKWLRDEILLQYDFDFIIMSCLTHIVVFVDRICFADAAVLFPQFKKKHENRRTCVCVLTQCELSNMDGISFV